MAPYAAAGIIAAIIVGGEVGGGLIGATIGILILAAFIYVATRRNRRIQMTLTDTRLGISNGGAVNEFRWQDVESVEPRWKYFGLLSPRGHMLHVTPRSGSNQSDTFIYASEVFRKPGRREVFEALTELSRRYGFALSPDLGPGPFWRSERPARA